MVRLTTDSGDPLRGERATISAPERGGVERGGALEDMVLCCSHDGQFGHRLALKSTEPRATALQVGLCGSPQ